MPFLHYKDGEIRFVEPEYELIRPFTNLIASRHGKKYGLKGDSDAAKKRYAYAELGVIWWCNSYKNLLNRPGKTQSQLREEARENFGLPSNWKPDQLFMEAEIEFRRGENTTIIKALTTLNNAIHVADTAVQRLTNTISEKLKDDKISDDDVNKLYSNLKLLLDLAAIIPEKAEALKNAEFKAKSEEEGKVISRGGQVVTNSMKKDKNV